MAKPQKFLKPLKCAIIPTAGALNPFFFPDATTHTKNLSFKCQRYGPDLCPANFIRVCSGKKSNLGTYELNKGAGGEPGKIFNHLPVKNEGALLIFRVNEDSHPEVSTLGLTDTCWRQRGPPNRAWLRGACEGSPGGCGSGEGASEREGEKTGRAS